MKYIILLLTLVTISIKAQDIGNVSNGESGTSVRTKINQTIDTLNEFKKRLVISGDTIIVPDSIYLKVEGGSNLGGVSNIDTLNINSTSNVTGITRVSDTTVTIRFPEGNVTLGTGSTSDKQIIDTIYKYVQDSGLITRTELGDTAAAIRADFPYWIDVDTIESLGDTMYFSYSNRNYQKKTLSSNLTLKYNSDSAKAPLCYAIVVNGSGHYLYFGVADTTNSIYNFDTTSTIDNYILIMSQGNEYTINIYKQISADITPPLLLSGQTTSDSTFSLTFNETITVTDTTGVRFYINDTLTQISSNLSGSGTTTLSYELLSDTIISTDTLKVSILSNNNIYDDNNNQLAQLTDSSITNNVVETGIPVDYVRYYDFNGDALEVSGSGDNGTVTNATLTTGINGNSNTAYEFNGTNARITFNSSFLNSKTAFTLSFWFLLNNEDDAFPGLVFSRGTEKCGVTLYNNDDFFLSVKLSVDNFISGITTATWYHIILTWQSGSKAIMYLDNTQVRSTSVTSGSFSGMDDVFSAGSDDGLASRWLDGKVDEVIFYDRVVTSDERIRLNDKNNYE